MGKVGLVGRLGWVDNPSLTHPTDLTYLTYLTHMSYHRIRFISSMLIVSLFR